MKTCRDCRNYRYYLGIRVFGDYLWCDIEKDGGHISRSYPLFRNFDEAHKEMFSGCEHFELR